MDLCKTFIFSSLPLLMEVTGIQSHTSTTAEEEYFFKKPFIPADFFSIPCSSTAHQTLRKAIKLCLLCPNYCLYLSQKLYRTA